MKNIYIINGTEILDMTLKLLRHVDPVKKQKKDMLIGIKPNLVVEKDASSGATTHAGIVEGIVIYLHEKGFKNIWIVESSWIGGDTKKAYKICGYSDLSDKYGVRLVDLKDDAYMEKEYKGMKIKIYKSVFDIDYLINVPLVKGHCQTGITCSLKNLKGLIPDIEKRRFHTLGLHGPIAYLNRLIRQDLIIADAICPDPYFEEGGDPRRLDKIFLAEDPVLMDSYAAGILGYRPDEIDHVRLACEEGVGDLLINEEQVIELNKVSSENIKIKKADHKYLNMISEANACSRCYSNLAAAMRELHKQGLDHKIADEICIGQAYKGYQGELGIGNCTSCFKKHLPGCPPAADEIVEFLKTQGS